MAGDAVLRLVGEITGIERDTDFHFLGDLAATPTKKADLVQIQATTDTEEALELGGISTPQWIVIYAAENSVDIDTSYSVSFNAELTVAEGEFAVIPAPSGTVYIKNTTTTEVVTVEVVAVGT
jgi:hypothetical protein